MITRRSLLTGMLASALIVPAVKIIRATEIVEAGECLWTSSWYEQIERGLWRQQCYRFKAANAPEFLVVNASPDAREIAGVQLDWSFDRIGSHVPTTTDALGWVRGNVDVKNRRGVEIELTRAEESDLMEHGARPTKIIRPEPSDLFGFFNREGSFT